MKRNFAFPARCRLLFALGIMIGAVFVSCTNHQTHGQERNHSYLSFSRPISPSDLNKLLGSSNAVQKKIVSDKIAEMVKEKFQSLTPEQKNRLAEISKEYANGKSSYGLTRKQQELEREIRQDPTFRKAAEDLRSALRNQDFPRDAVGQREFERGVQQELQQRLQRELSQYRPEMFNDPKNSSGSRDPNSGFPKNPFVPGGNSTDPGTGRNSSDPTQGQTKNPFRVGPGQRSPQTPFSNGGNGNSNSNPRSNSFGPGNFENGNSGRGGNSDPGGNRNSGSGNNPFGGFSDDGKGSFGSRSTEPGVASASGQNNSLPKESIGHRFNRMVMNSVEKAMERKVGAEGVSGEGTQGFRRMLNKFVDSVANSNPNVSSRINSGGSGIMNRLRQSLRRGSSGFKMPNLNRMGGGAFSSSGGGGGMGMSLPAFSPRGILTFMIVVGLIVGVIMFAVKKTPLAQYLGIQKQVKASGPPPELQVKIQEYDQIVELIDRFTLWLYGKRASWWNSKKVQSEVAKANPELAEDIREMMNIYDAARYAKPDQPVSNQMVNQVKSTLRQIKEFATEKEKVRTSQPSPNPRTA